MDSINGGEGGEGVHGHFTTTLNCLIAIPLLRTETVLNLKIIMKIVVTHTMMVMKLHLNFKKNFCWFKNICHHKKLHTVHSTYRARKLEQNYLFSYLFH